MKSTATIGLKTFESVDETMEFFTDFVNNAPLGKPFASKKKAKPSWGLDRKTMLALFHFHPDIDATTINWSPLHFSVVLDRDTGERVFCADFKNGISVVFDHHAPCFTAFMEDEVELMLHLALAAHAQHLH